MTTRIPGSAPVRATTTTSTASTEQVNPQDYLKTKLDQDKGFVEGFLGETYGKSFTDKVNAEVAKLDPNMPPDQLTKAVDDVYKKEMTNQVVVKSTVEMASNRIMNRIKELSSDTFQSE